MIISFDWSNLIISSDASITDLPAFHTILRDAEDSEAGIIRPTTHTWKALDLGSGATFYQADFINGWQLKFPVSGNYEIRGNLNATIVPVAGVYIERRTSAAFITTSVGSTSGTVPTASEISNSVWSHPFVSKLLTVAKFLGLK